MRKRGIKKKKSRRKKKKEREKVEERISSKGKMKKNTLNGIKKLILCCFGVQLFDQLLFFDILVFLLNEAKYFNAMRPPPLPSHLNEKSNDQRLIRKLCRKHYIS